jgi:hypothetical protein
VLRLQPEKSLTALVAIVGLIGLSFLPLEHVHSRREHDRAHHTVTVHRHAAAQHHSGGHQGLVASSGRAIVHASDDDDDTAQTLHVFFTSGERVTRHQPVLTASSLNDLVPDTPDGRRLEEFLWRPPPHGPQLDPARPLRAPPARPIV